MSRLKRFTRSLFSGYVLLGANILYTFASVPLALSYLSKPEFGLWALVTTIAGYIALIDFGMSGSVSRILIDYKDRRAGGEYGSMIQTGALVGAVQGVLVFVAGAILALAVGPLLGIPKELERDFVWLVIGQCGLLGASFAARIFSHLLAAHQRYDVTNYASTLLFAVNYGVMWFCFARGLGVFSILWAQASGTVLVIAVNWLGCARLHVFPARGEWGKPAWSRFKELFAFGRDIFLYALGAQLINASQTLLLTRFIGLESAAVWNVCTRTYTLCTQIIFRIFDYSCPGLAEMMVRGERDRLLSRYQSIVVVSCSLSVVGAVWFTVCNQPFIHWWTSGRIGWSPVNDALLAVWLVISVAAHCHLGITGQTKDLRFMKYIYFLEGIFFVGGSLLVLGNYGVTGMVWVSIAGSLLFSLPYGNRRVSEYFGLSLRKLAQDWYGPAVRVLMVLAPLAVLGEWLTQSLAAPVRLVICMLLLGPLSLGLLLGWGLDGNLQSELLRRVPGRLRPIMLRFLRPGINS